MQKRESEFIMPGGRPRKYSDPAQMQKGIEKYLKEAVGPNKAGLAHSLGFSSKAALNEYLEYKEFSNLVKKTFLYIEQFWTERLLKPACTGAIFWLKNNAGYSDRRDYNIQGEITFSQALSKATKKGEKDV